ncbi:MAG: prenyltransferase/squalene oxidase repeat-containing protein [Syntrophomonas sp.]
MNIDLESYIDKEPLFNKEINNAINWLLKIQDVSKNGWGWIQHIPPNEQNTAEVVRALLENIERLSADQKVKITLAIKNWLIDPSRHATIAIDWAWVLKALQKVEKCIDNISQEITIDQIRKSKSDCIKWLINNQNEDDGWSDNKGDVSSVSRTSLVITVLANEEETIENAIQLKEVIRKATQWVVKSQNQDGGWGNVRRETIEQQLQMGLNMVPYNDVECQYCSNAACTGYAIIALNRIDFHKYGVQIKKGVEFIEKIQMQNGCWSVFCEVGLRNNEIFTFRHFSTTWALTALLESKIRDNTSYSVLNGVEYLLSLQDEMYGGWKSSIDSDSYTWSTCNVLELLAMVEKDLKHIKAKHFLCIVKEWWKLKTEKGTHTWGVGRAIFAFNIPVWLLFCLTYTLLLLTWDGMLILFTDKIVIIKSTQLLKVIKAFEAFIVAMLIGIPWVVLIKHAFKREMNGWLSTIAWVYGIITGVLIAFYGFIIN